MSHVILTLLIGIAIGLSAAAPIGPVNFEIIRRNLTLGLKAGIGFGLGACTADLCYLIVVCVGLVQYINNLHFHKIISLIGALVLLFFGYQCLKKSSFTQSNDTPKPKSQPTAYHFLQGFIMTLSSPYAIIFWASLSAQLVHLHLQQITSHLTTAGIGVLCGTMAWAIGFNFLINKIQRQLQPNTMRLINRIGGCILCVFALFCLFLAFK